MSLHVLTNTVGFEEIARLRVLPDGPSPPTSTSRLLQCSWWMQDCTRSDCFCDTIGPTAVLGSAGLPTVKSRIASRMACFSASSRLLGTRSLVPCAQAWPLFRNAMARVADDFRIEHGVIEQNRGRFAAQFQRDALHRRVAIAHDRLANGNRACERNLGHIRSAHKLCPYDIAEAGDHVEKALRQVGLVQSLNQDLRLQGA